MASVLETFFILFESNSDKLKKGNEDAQRSTVDLEDKLKNTDRQANELGEHMISTFTEVGVAIAAAFSVTRIAEWVRSTAEASDQLGKTSQRLNISIEDLDAYSQAANRASGGTANFTGTLDFLNKGMADIATKGTSRLKPFFDELGVRVTDGPKKIRPLLSILGDLSDKLSKMDRQQAAGIGEKLGIDEGTLLLLVQGRQALDDLVDRQRSLGTVTGEDAEIGERFNDQLEDTEQIFRNVSLAIGRAFLPSITDALKWIEKTFGYLAQHKGIVEGFFIGVAGVIATIYTPAAIEAAFATWAFLSPILAIVVPILAVGAAIGLLVDDVMNFLDGNQSVIGELSKSWPIIGETVRAVVDVAAGALTWFFDLLKGGFHLAYAIIAAFTGFFINAFEAIGRKFHGIGEGLAKAFPLWNLGFRAVAAGIELLVGWLEKAVGWFLKLAGSAVAGIPKALEHWAQDIDGGAAGGDARRALALAGGARIGAQTSSSINTVGGSKSVSVQTGPVTIQTQATDSEGIAGAFSGHLGDQMRQTVAHFDDGVKS